MSVEMFCDYVHSGTFRFLRSIYMPLGIFIAHIKGKRKKFAKLGEKSDFIKKTEQGNTRKKTQINDV